MSSPTLSGDALINHVLSNRKDYYRMLNVSHNATAEEIKKSYKKVALSCHPDKSSHPRANEAFQLANTAQSTLTDPQKRAVYDRHGTEGVTQHESGGGGGGGQRGGGQYYYQRQQQFQHPFEEFFFQFNRPPPRRPPGHGGQAGQQQQEYDVNLNLFMLAPIVLFILLAMMLQTSTETTSSSTANSFGGSNQRTRNANAFAHAFSLVPNHEEGFTVARHTEHPQFPFHVKYYVSKQWNDMANRGYIDVRRTEFEVLKKHRDSLGRRCESEVLRQRSKGKKDTPQVCADYESLRDRVRG